MRKNTLMKFASLIIFLLTTFVSYAQPAPPGLLTIKMNIDFEGWDRDDKDTWYDRITFTDDGDFDISTPAFEPNPDNGNNGRFFRTKVRPNQPLRWESSYENAPENFEGIILISVMRNPSPGMGGNEILDKPWYNSNGNGSRIQGRTRNQDLTLQIERYLVSFLVYYGNNDYDIYTVDPIIRGSE